jgi:adenosylcobinamide kinase/adenosylcobinamide-phosphate guanylyltransferase
VTTPSSATAVSPLRVQLLGTGSADGWPNPFCTCASCQGARAGGEVRGHTSALVDGRILLDCGPDTPRAAARFGAVLNQLSVVLLTHAHPDHVHGLALLAREWAHVTSPLVVAGPARALAEVEPWLAPGAPVRLHPMLPGDRWRHDGYEVTALAATHDEDTVGTALLFDVAGPYGQRLLYATDTGPLRHTTLDAVAHRAYDLVLLEETFGDRGDHGTDHLDLETFPRALAALRRNRAVTEATRVVAVHLSHHNPAPPVLRDRLTPWGVEVGTDGAVLTFPGTDAGTSTTAGRTTRRTLVTGGARSGKSRAAERLLADRDDVCYLATAETGDTDDEMLARIAHHRRRRPATWTTSETTDLESVLRSAEPGAGLLVDCLTVWLARVLDETGAWASGETDLADKRITALVEAWRDTAAHVVAVSNEVGSGVVPATPAGRVFRDLQGRLNAAVADASDEVLLVVSGQTIRLRPPHGEDRG